MSLLDEFLAISTELDMRPFDGAGSVSARYFEGLKKPVLDTLARIHRRYDVTAAEWAMRDKRRRWSGRISGE